LPEFTLLPSARRSALLVLTAQIAIVAAFFLAWQWLSGRVIDPMLISDPVAIYHQAVLWLRRGILQKAALETLWIVLAGVVAGGLSGVLTGIAAGCWRDLEAVLDPYVTLIFALPKVALIPLFILWFGTGDLTKFALATVAVFFFFYYTGLNGMRSVPVAMDNLLKLNGADFWQRLRLLYLPAGFGWTLSGLRVALPYAFVSVIGAEVMSAAGGLGYLSKNNAVAMNAAGALTAMLALTLLAALCGWGVTALAAGSRWQMGSDTR
jgi:NitT/TauT family transport system permease protein